MTRRGAAQGQARISRRDDDGDACRVHRHLAGWCLAIAAAGMPAAAAVLIWSDSTNPAAGAGVIGTISVAAFTTARSLMRSVPGSGAERQDSR